MHLAKPLQGSRGLLLILFPVGFDQRLVEMGSRNLGEDAQGRAEVGAPGQDPGGLLHGLGVGRIPFQGLEIELQGLVRPFQPLIGICQQKPAAGEFRVALHGRLQKRQGLESLPLVDQTQGVDVVLEGPVELPGLAGGFGRLPIPSQLAVQLGQLGVIEGVLGVRPGGQLQRFQGGGHAAGGALLLTHSEEDGGIRRGQLPGNFELLVGIPLASLDSQQQGIELAKTGLAGVDLDGAARMFQCRIQMFLNQEKERQAVVDPFIAVSEPVGFLKVADCLGEPALSQIGLAQAAMGFRVQWLQ